MKITKNVGMLLLAIWLILWGLMAAIPQVDGCHGERSEFCGPYQKELL